MYYVIKGHVSECKNASFECVRNRTGKVKD